MIFDLMIFSHLTYLIANYYEYNYFSNLQLEYALDFF